MKKLILFVSAIILSLGSQTAFAETYTLIFDSECSSKGEKLDFSCKPEPSFSAQKTIIFLRDGKWFGLEGASQNVFPLNLIKRDENIIIFDYPVFYSGIATITLMKKTGRFYFSETAYSDILNVQEVSIEGGSFSLGKE